MEYLQRTHILRNQGSGWGTSPNENRFAKRSFQSGSRCVQCCGMASHPRPTCLSCGFRTFQPFSEQPSATVGRVESQAGLSHFLGQCSQPLLKKSLAWFSPVLSSLADTPRGPGLGWRERTGAKGAGHVREERRRPQAPRIPHLLRLQASRSLRSESCFSFLARFKNLVTGKTQRGPKGLLRGGSWKAVPPGGCRVEKRTWRDSWKARVTSGAEVTPAALGSSQLL